MWLFQCTNVIEKNDYIPWWHPATNKTRKDFCELFPQYRMVVVIVVIMAVEACWSWRWRWPSMLTSRRRKWRCWRCQENSEPWATGMHTLLAEVYLVCSELLTGFFMLCLFFFQDMSVFWGCYPKHCKN